MGLDVDELQVIQWTVWWDSYILITFARVKNITSEPYGYLKLINLPPANIN